LEKAKAELATVTEAERERLPGYEPTEIEHSPPIRRVTSAIRRLEFQLTANEEILWSNFVSGIDDEEDKGRAVSGSRYLLVHGGGSWRRARALHHVRCCHQHFPFELFNDRLYSSIIAVRVRGDEKPSKTGE